MTVQQKLAQIAERIGFPFAINGAGYDQASDNYGIQAWSCEADAEAEAGATIYVFNDQYEIDSWPEMSSLYESVEHAKFFQEEDGCVYFE